MNKEILRFSMLIVLTSLVFNVAAQKPAPSNIPQFKVYLDSSLRQPIRKDSTKVERLDRLHRYYRERIVEVMSNTKLSDAARLAESNRLIAEKSKKMKAVQELQEDKVDEKRLRSLLKR